MRYLLASGLAVALGGGIGCSDSGSTTGGDAGGSGVAGGNTSGSGGRATPGGSGTEVSGASPKGGREGAGTGGNATSARGGAPIAGTSGAGGGFSSVGVCGQRGKAIANPTSFDGFEEFFMISGEGLGEDVCVIRFDMRRVGDAPAGCSACRWTHLLEYGDATVLTDVEGVCANSELALNAAAIAKIVGSRVAIGFAPELDGAHGSARMKYWVATMSWDVNGNATWDEAAAAFRYDHRDGFCNY